MNSNIFYLFKGEQQTATDGQFNTETGEFESATEVGQYCVTSWLTNLRPTSRNSIPVFNLFTPDVLSVKSVRVFMYDKDVKYLGFSVMQIGAPNSFAYSQF